MNLFLPIDFIIYFIQAEHKQPVQWAFLEAWTARKRRSTWRQSARVLTWRKRRRMASPNDRLGATKLSLFYHVSGTRLVWGMCGDFRTWLTKVAVVSEALWLFPSLDSLSFEIVWRKAIETYYYSWIPVIPCFFSYFLYGHWCPHLNNQWLWFAIKVATVCFVRFSVSFSTADNL